MSEIQCFLSENHCFLSDHLCVFQTIRFLIENLYFCEKTNIFLRSHMLFEDRYFFSKNNCFVSDHIYVFQTMYFFRKPMFFCYPHGKRKKIYVFVCMFVLTRMANVIKPMCVFFVFAIIQMANARKPMFCLLSGW